MRTLIVEVEAGTKTIEVIPDPGRRMARTEKVSVFHLLKLEIPDNAKVTLQGMNPTHPFKGQNNPSMLRVYQGSDKKQIACIPNVVAFREDTVKVSQLGSKSNVVGKVWQEVEGSMLGPEAQWYRINEDDELEPLEF